MGVSLVPEDRSLFFDLTVHENVRLGGRGHRDAAARDVRAVPRARRASEAQGGIAVGWRAADARRSRGLAARPRLLVVDEMSLGLAPLIVDRLLALLERVVTDTGTALLIVEQHAHLSLAIADRAYVLNHGELVLEGRAEDFRESARPDRGQLLGEAALASDD